MNEIELLIPGEFRLHLRLPFNMMELLENLEHDNPVLINAFDDQDRNLVIECIRVEDLITMRVVNDSREFLSDAESNGWTCSVSDILAQLNPMSSSTTDMMTRPGDDFMTSVMIKEERSHDESETAFILSMVNEYMEPEESCTLLQLSEEQPAEEVIFGNDCKVLAYSTNEPLVAAVDDDSGNSENYYIQIHPADLESLADGSSIIISHVEPYNREPADKRKYEAVAESVDEIHRPKIVSDLLVFRCGRCSCQFLKEERGKTHLRRFHPHSDATLLTEVAVTTYVCTVCSQPFWNVCRWRLHLKHVHSTVSGHQQKPHSKFDVRHRKRMTSWDNRTFVPIECFICQRKMVLFESYYMHIHKHHRSHSLYRAAVRHVIQVRETRRRRKCKASIQCLKCHDVFTEYNIVSHLRVLHADDPGINEMITRTKLSIKKMMKSHNGAKVNVRCQFCEKELSNGLLKSHLEFHCPALNAVAPDGEIKQEVLENAAKNEVETVLVRMPRTAACEQCNKVMTLRSFYHHQRRVHGIGINNAKIYSCSYCKKPFWDQYHLQNHLLTHTRDRAFVCLVCRRSFINLVSYTEHHRKVHERQFLHACSACGRGFWKRVDKLRHNCKPQNLCLNQLRNAHLTAKAKATMEKWIGPFYVEMDRREADKVTTSRSKGVDVKRKQSGLQAEKKLVCVVCKKSFQSIRYFQSHFRYSHLQDYDLICEGCGLGFWNTTQMTAHKCEPSRRAFNEKKRHLLATRAKEMLRNVPKPYYYVLGVPDHSLDYPELIKIDMERKVLFDEKNNGDSDAALVEHDSEVVEKVRCVNEQSAIVNTVNQRSNKIGNLSAQELKKVDDGSADSLKLTVVQPGYCLCSICGKEIKVKNYYPHMRRVHCDDSHKPITWKVCDQCGYRCQDNYKFRRHCMIHNKGKGIPCELCNRLSYEVVDYNQHFKRRHLGQFNIRCNDCGKGFWKMNAMQAHTCYPELREENLRMQKLKEEAAIKKRNMVRKVSGINSGIDEENGKQQNHRKNGAKKKTATGELNAQVVIRAEHDAENVFNRSEERTSKQRSPGRPKRLQRSVISVEPELCLEGRNTIQSIERSELIVDSQVQNGTETLAAGKSIARSDGLEKGRNEIETNTEELSVEVIGQKRGVASLLDSVSSNGEEGTVQKRCKLENTVDKTQYSCSAERLNETSHRYGTRKKQLSFRALLGKK